MSTYEDFIVKKMRQELATGHNPDSLNPHLKAFQKAIALIAVKKGRFLIGANTGLGKTIMQLSWADEVQKKTDGLVLILAPLAVSEQTIAEGEKFGVKVHRNKPEKGIFITNYEQIDKIDFSELSGIVLDESSILKSQVGKTKLKIISSAQVVPYRLSCSATPSPNDFEELGNQCEFLGVCTRAEMLATYFVNDTGDTGTWRLKGWGASKFWEWMASWAVIIRSPEDMGFYEDGYSLGEPNYIEHVIQVANKTVGDMFGKVSGGLKERRQAQRESINERCEALAEIVNSNKDEPWLIWCHLNSEAELLERLIDGAVNLQGSEKPEVKTAKMLKFTSGEIRVLISKPKICGFGMNWQHCSKMAFVGLDDSFEKFYQAVRRCHRFGQTKTVDVHIFTAENEGQILANIKRKHEQHEQLSKMMVEHMKEITMKEISGQERSADDYEEETVTGKNYTIHLGDCVKWAARIESDSVDYSIFSPPFADLFVYSNSDYDMGNCFDDDAFIDQFNFLISELYRILKPGANLSFHCMNLQTKKMVQGFIGLRDFRGDLIRAFQSAGFIYHSEVCIWKDPVVAMQRTKALGLLHKTVRENSSMARMGLPDYVVTMRKPGERNERVTHQEENELPVHLWQKYASPVWMDINQSNTLNKMPARDENDEKHMCPLQLDVIERCIHLWTNKNDLIFSPFAGIGSEGHCALKMGRRFIGTELKRQYFDVACDNLKMAANVNQLSLL